MQMFSVQVKFCVLVFSLVASLGLTGCSTSADLLEKDDGSMTVKDGYIWRTTAFSAGAGAAVGAGTGYLITKNATGAGIGAAVGALLGGAIGNVYANDVKSRVEAAGSRRSAVVQETAALRRERDQLAATNQQLADDIRSLKQERESLATTGLNDPSAKERQLAFDARVREKQQQVAAQLASEDKRLNSELHIAAGVGASGEETLTDEGNKKFGAEASTQELQALDAEMRNLQAEWKRLRAQRDELAKMN